jgi:hypothetical protein
VHGRLSFGSHQALTTSLLLLVAVISIVVHEALHALGFIFIARAPRSSVHFGVDRRTLTPYAGCKAPVRASAYRAACLLPGIVLGLIPSALGIAIGNAPIAVFGAWMLAAAGGDLAAVIAMRRVSGSALVLDHPSRVGCRVVGEEERNEK